MKTEYQIQWLDVSRSEVVTESGEDAEEVRQRAREAMKKLTESDFSYQGPYSEVLTVTCIVDAELRLRHARKVFGRAAIDAYMATIAVVMCEHCRERIPFDEIELFRSKTNSSRNPDFCSKCIEDFKRRW